MVQEVVLMEQLVACQVALYFRSVQLFVNVRE